MVEYKNRYGDVYTFTKQEDGSVLWEELLELMQTVIQSDQTGLNNTKMLSVAKGIMTRPLVSKTKH